MLGFAFKINGDVHIPPPTPQLSCVSNYRVNIFKNTHADIFIFLLLNL